MNIKNIQRRKELKDSLVQIWYKLMKPLVDLIDNIDDKKYKKVRKKAKSLTDEEAMDIVIKRIMKRIKKYGKFDDEIVICSRIKNKYCDNELYNFIKDINWSDSNRVLTEWSYINRYKMVENIEYTEKLVDILKMKLDKIKGVKTKYYIEENVNWHYENYKRTLRISLEE